VGIERAKRSAHEHRIELQRVVGRARHQPEPDPRSRRAGDRNRFRRIDFATWSNSDAAPGRTPRSLAQIADAVHAFDFSEGMLAWARSRVTSPQVSFARLDLNHEQWPISTDPPIWPRLIWFSSTSDLCAPVLSRAAACLSSGGILHVSELHPFRQYEVPGLL
jgi:hypothetical protein